MVNQDGYRSETDAPVGHMARQAADLRGAPRFTLLVRTAKLVVDGREYLCVLRDASATGCKVRLFHPVPHGRSLMLETSNGDRVPMDLMWARDDHAGFRFHYDVDVQSLIDDSRGAHPKRQIRLQVDRNAMVLSGGRKLPVLIHDISQQGACIESVERLMLRQSVGVELAGFPMITGKICWRQSPRHGLVFDKGFQLEELALHLVKMYEATLQGGVGPLRAAS